MADSDRAALVTAIEARIGASDPRDPEMASEDQKRHAALDANTKMISLNRDEKEPLEAVVVMRVQNFCSADGNCSLWFFRKSSHGYRLLLDAIGEGFLVQETTTNGFKDLVVNMHSSATEQWLKVYRYAHGRYWRVACYDAEWAPLDNGVIHELKEPRITPSPCN
ncbi:MAG TPA: hypothetical protein VJR23_08410 [Candidatus Acidoferrales bacterium]|nr:hypothetical protein [Candidatus Acidoferrales bacterium]